MSANLARLRKRAAELEQKKQFDRALEVYVQILDEGGKELDDEDVPLFNRVGDMLMRKGSVTEALGYYERAVDMYAERGYLNNAIALCSKILRQSPGRAAVYYKLARISAKKGFKSDARKNFLEYADRMQKLGMADEAFRALKEFASLYPDQDDVRLVLAELLSKENRKGEAIEQLQSLYEKLQAEGRSAEARATVDRMRAIDPNATPREGNQTTAPAPAGDLIFLDLSDGSAENGASPASARAPVRTPVPALTGLSITFLPPNADAPHPEGFESTAVEPEPVETTPVTRSLTPLGGELVVDQLPASDPPARDVQGYVPFDVIEGAPEQAPADAEGEPEPEEVTPRSSTPRHMTPRSATPRSATPRSATPRSATPRHMTPRSVTRDVTPRHNTPMSGIEFAHLELDDAPREHAPRRHDLSLPGDLPVTPPDATAAVSGPVPTSDAAAEDARRAAMDAADLAADMAAREAGLLLPAPGPVSPPVIEEPYDEPPTVLEFEPLVPEEPPEPEPEPEPETIPDDFMALPPSFGSSDQHSDEHAAFPPIFGLVESAGEEELAEQELAEQELAEEAAAPAEEDEPAPAATVQQPTLSLGSAEAHLRRRLELEPENWELRRQLGEALLDTGDRDGGLYELELAMAGFELCGDLDRAQEVVDEILGVFPASVAHHQKRVEYAVRSRDRVRLTNSYLELADALFRSGAGDKAVAVYARVLELDTNNERAEFALSTLAPDELVRLRGAPERPDRWTAELDAIDGNAAAEPAADASAGITVEPPVEGPVAAPPDESEAAAPAAVAAAPAPAPQNPETVEIIGLELPDPDWGEGLPTPAPVAAISPQPAEPEHPVTEIEWKVEEQVVPREASTTGDSSPPVVKEEPPEDLVFELAEDLPPEVTPTVAPERIPTPSAAKAPFTRMDTPASIEAAAPRPPTPRATPPVAKPPVRRLTPVGASDSDFVDLGDWLRHTEPTRSTRMHVEDPKPTGDEQADFDEMLRRFKRGIAENVEAEDFEAHYDLGVAYKEMGLVDEAIAQFQKSLRGDSHRVRSYEALGQCFVEQKQYPIASALLQRATEVPGSDDRQLVGVLYLLGFALEHLGRPAEALQYYLRVFAVDIEFRDVAARIAAMGNLTK